MTEKGCDNCYYSFFDERAYPCSLCIRGVERTDRWQPSKKTKADRNSSEKPNNCEAKNYCDDCLYTDTCDSKEFFYACTSKATISKMEQVEDEPQTESHITCYGICTDKCGAYENGDCTLNAKKVDTPQTDCETCKYAQIADEHCEFCGEAYIDNYEPQTERSE